ncbi:hypothetical protein HMPREF3189_00618 [Clostridiales bacterium KA00134]|nr:hypothetical protein HMPREF3189_00618 [Clostridiales bacterium KA00134]
MIQDILLFFVSLVGAEILGKKRKWKEKKILFAWLFIFFICKFLIDKLLKQI